MIKRRVALFLAALLLVSSSLPAAHAAQADLFFGKILVLGVGAEQVEEYSAARNEQDGTVYIRAEDFARIVGAELRDSGHGMSFLKGEREVYVNTEKNTAKVYFNVDGGDVGTYFMYDTFALPELIYNEAQQAWYLPMEEMLYMYSCEWLCQKGIVLVYQPETLLDIVAESGRMRGQNPDYSDLMGKNESEVWKNAFQYGFWAAIDEIDMTFLKDAILTGLGMKAAMTYEEDVLKAALMTLRSDLPEDAATDDYQDVDDGVGSISDFMESAGAALGMMSPETISDMLYALSDISVGADTAERIGNIGGLGGDLIPYFLGVGEALWARDQMPKGFGDRLKRIAQLTPSGNSDTDTLRERFAKDASEVYNLYYGAVVYAWINGVTLDDICSLIDGTTTLAGVDLAAGDLAIGPLRTMSTVVAAYRLGVEVMKNEIPAMQAMLEEAEDAHLCLYLINLSAIMSQAYIESAKKLGWEPLSQELLDETRITAQIMECAALHAHEKLRGIGKEDRNDTYYEEAEFLMRLKESSKYDGLILLNTDFRDIHSDAPGCTRESIPPEYVYDQYMVIGSNIAEYNGVLYSSREVPGMTVLSPQRAEGYDICAFAFYDGKLYYACKTPGTSEISSKLYRSNPDGSVPELLAEDTFDPATYRGSSEAGNCLNFVICGGYLYYGSSGCIDLSTGKAPETLPESAPAAWETLANRSAQIRYYGSLSYVIDGDQVLEVDENGAEQLLGVNIPRPRILAVTQDSIYLSSYADSQGMLWRMNRQTGESELIDSHPAAGGGDTYFNW